METNTLIRLEERADLAETKFKENLEVLEDHVSDTVEAVTDKVGEVAGNVKQVVSAIDPTVYVEKSPVLSVSVAVVAGGMIGYRMRGPRRMARREAAPGNAKASAKGSLLGEVTRGIFVSAVSALFADWGRKKFPEYRWAIDAAESVTGHSKTFH